MVAVVIFGIFLSLSYWLFQDEMKNVLANVMDGVKSGTLIKIDGSLGIGVEPEEVLVPNAESDFLFDPLTGTITGYKGIRKDVVIPSTINGVLVKVIGDASFKEKGLISVYIPDSIISIGYQAFYGYAKQTLTTVRFPKNLQNIGMQAFSYNKLKSIVLPNSLTTLGSNSFLANELTYVTLSNNLKVIETNAFRYNKITDIVIPDSIETIGAWAFEDNLLTSIELPEKLTKIISGAFRNNQITSVHIPNAITNLPWGVFYDNPLTTVEMAEGTTYVKTSVGTQVKTFPDGVTITYYTR